MEGEDTLLWISRSAPAEAAYAGLGSPGNNNDFPRTIADTKRLPTDP